MGAGRIEGTDKGGAGASRRRARPIPTSSTRSREPKNCHHRVLQITPPPGPRDCGSGPARTWAPNILRTIIRAVRRPRVRYSSDYPDRSPRPVSQNTPWTGGTSASSLISGASFPSHWALVSGLEPGFQRAPCNGCHARVLAPPSHPPKSSNRG